MPAKNKKKRNVSLILIYFVVIVKAGMLKMVIPKV